MEPALSTNDPFSDLPNEIISSILEEHSLDAHNTQPPWSMGHICSRWREVALGIPTLWNLVIVDLDQHGRGNTRSFEIANELLWRSGLARITCMIRCKMRHASPIEHAFRLLTHHANRVRHLTIDRIERISDLGVPIEVPLSSLECLEISLKHWIDGEYSVSTSFTLLDKAPNLRQVVLSTEGLMECSLCIPFDVSPPLQTLNIITLPHLHTLDITTNGPGDYGQFLQLLTLPSLRILTLPANANNVDWSQNDLVEFLERSACQIEEFTLKGDAQGMLLPTLLAKMPFLIRLSLTQPSLLPNVVEKMVLEQFLPDLRWLECTTSLGESTVKMLKVALDGNKAVLQKSAADDRLCVVSLVVERVLDGEDGVTWMRELQSSRFRFDVRKRGDFHPGVAVEGGLSDDYSSEDDTCSEEETGIT